MLVALQPPLITVDDVLKLPNPAPDARIPYGSDPLQFGDLRLPKTRGPHAVVVVIHGGCWRSQYTIDHIGSFSDALTRDGLATWTIEYRRVGDPGGGWPGTFLDVGAGIDHLRRLCEEHPLDLGRVVVVGHSAGGHLALWAGARPKLTEASIRGSEPLAPKGVVSLAGVDNLRRALDDGVCDNMAAELLGGTPAEVPERYAVASPIELLPLGLPQHLVSGARDPVVPEAFGRAYSAAARDAGDEATLSVIPDAGHFELIAPSTAAWRQVKKAIWGILE